MTDLHAVPEPPNSGQRFTAARYRAVWATLLGIEAFFMFFALIGVFDVVAFGLLTVLVLLFAAVATRLRVRQLRRDREQWPS